MTLWQKFFILILFLPSSNFTSLEKSHIALEKGILLLQEIDQNNPESQIALCDRLIEHTEFLLSQARDGFPIYDFYGQQNLLKSRRIEIQVFSLDQKLARYSYINPKTGALKSDLQDLSQEIAAMNGHIGEAKQRQLESRYQQLYAKCLLAEIDRLSQLYFAGERPTQEETAMQNLLISRLHEFVGNFPNHTRLDSMYRLIRKL